MMEHDNGNMEKRRHIWIQLVNSYGPWNKARAMDESFCLWTRGYVFINGQYYSGQALVQHILDCLVEVPTEAHISILKNLTPQLNGAWALVYETDNVVLAAVDRFRSLPLFYAMRNNRVFISDNAGKILKCLNHAELDDICATEFLVTGYVTGKETLYKELYQIRAGEILEVKILKDTFNQISTCQYYRFITSNYFQADKQELEEELSKLLHQIFSRYVIALKGKTPVIPLSGGLDSRLIAAMFKKCGVENVICFSYGRHGNAEAEASRAVAKTLGYKWLFCPYDSWYDWFRSEQYRSYIEYASGLSSISHEQDWPATMKLSHEILDDDVVFVPGHSLDLLAGSQIPSELFHAKEEIRYETLVYEAVLFYNYKLWPWYKACPKLKDLFVGRIKDRLPDFPNHDKSEAIKAYETWFIEGKIAKFILNSMRVYEYFNCQWMLPGWDYELVDFFSKIKLDFRYKKRLYRSTLLNRIFTSQLGDLARIPVFGMPLLETEDKRKEKGGHVGLPHFVYQILRRPIPDSIVDVHRSFKNRRNDYLALYEIFMEKGLRSTKLEDLIPPSMINRLPLSVRRILQANRKRPVAALSINGLHAAFHLALLVDR